MTLLAYRPELGVTLAEGSRSGRLPRGPGDELLRLEQELRTLVIPLTQVRSLPAAAEQAGTIAPAYIDLAIQWGKTQWQVHGSASSTHTRSPLFDDIRRSGMVSEEAMEQLHGALESSVAYFDWITKSYETLSGEEKQRATAALEGVGDVVAGAEAALLALGLAVRGFPGSAPQAVPVLAELVDQCWTAVEDTLMSLTEYGDEGGTIPLSEVKAELGL